MGTQHTEHNLPPSVQLLQFCIREKVFDKAPNGANASCPCLRFARLPVCDTSTKSQGKFVSGMFGLDSLELFLSGSAVVLVSV